MRTLRFPTKIVPINTKIRATTLIRRKNTRAGATMMARGNSTQTAHGVVARRQALNYEMGLGRERFDTDLKAWASDHRYSESNHRRFYRRWAQLMEADSLAAAAADD